MDRTNSIKKYLGWLLLALPSALVAVVGVFLAWGQQHLPFVHAAGTGETVSFRMAIPFGSTTGPPPPATLSPPYGCNTATLGSNDCAVPVNSVFTLQVFIDGAVLKNNDGDLAIGSTAGQVRLNYTTGLGLGKQRPGTTELGPMGAPFWPDCDDATRSESSAAKLDGTPSYVASCTALAGVESTYAGLVMEQDFTCDVAGKQTIRLKSTGSTSDSYVADDIGGPVYDPAGSRYLTVLCLGDKNVDPSVDSDSDGCTDVKEQGTNPQQGGMRNPNYYWDFYDTPNSSNVRDKVVTVTGDILRVAQRFGANDAGGTAVVNRNSNQLAGPIPAAPGYHPSYDRGALFGPNQWDRLPPDGTIAVTTDILGVARQFGHSCL